MNGIVFYKTRKYKQVREFYESVLALDIWLEQKECVIYQYGNFLLGFCNREEADTESMITMFFDSRLKVDSFYKRLEHIAVEEPKYNSDYEIYHFFAEDPEGRTLEFQYFENDIKPYISSMDALKTRRSTRRFSEKEVTEDILKSIFELCRYSPTSMNTQAYYYVVISDKSVIEKLSSERAGASLPLAQSDLNIAVCVDSAKTKRVQEDGIIAAYHLILACETHGLGTCWIADMNRSTVKKLLNIPKEHYIATITPVGFRDKPEDELPQRRNISDFVIWK